MNKYFFEKFINFAKNLQLLKLSSIPWVIFTGLVAGVLTFHLQVTIKSLFISLPPWNVPVLGQILGREYDLFPALTGTLFGLIIWFFLFWGLMTILDYLFSRYIVWLSTKQKELIVNFTDINPNVFSDGWEIQGSPILRKDGLAFTNSNSGCLINRRSLWWIIPNNLRMWKNFRATVKVDFIQESHKVNDLKEGVWVAKTEEYRRVLGVVFQAQNLEDYYMLEIWRIDNTLSFRPHIRLSGNWDAPHFNAPQKCTLNKSGAITFSLEVRENIATIKLGNRKVFQWIVPVSFEANLIQHKDKGADKGVITKISFRNKAGRFGFRNYGNELALVKELSIEPLNTNKRDKKDHQSLNEK